MVVHVFNPSTQGTGAGAGAGTGDPDWKIRSPCADNTHKNPSPHHSTFHFYPVLTETMRVGDHVLQRPTKA